MAKLVILNQDMTGRAHELTAERTTIGRVEENNFQISDPSVSSRHCEVLLRGGEVLVRDLNSTNGSFINDEKITEKVLKPGQKLRLGQVELKLEDPNAPAASPTSSVPVPPPAPVKKALEPAVVPRGVSLSELESGGGRPPGFDSSTSFSKKSNKVNKFFLIGGLIVGLIILVLLYMAYRLIGQGK
jgi:pSer/pThr/pTyr-binding forkhead associated (FHA) protein